MVLLGVLVGRDILGDPTAIGILLRQELQTFRGPLDNMEELGGSDDVSFFVLFEERLSNDLLGIIATIIDLGCKNRRVHLLEGSCLLFQSPIIQFVKTKELVFRNVGEKQNESLNLLLLTAKEGIGGKNNGKNKASDGFCGVFVL